MILCCLLALLMVALLAVNLAVGSVSIPLRDVVSIVTGHEAARPSWQFIIMESRLPQAITAMLCGGALAVISAVIAVAVGRVIDGLKHRLAKVKQSISLALVQDILVVGIFVGIGMLAVDIIGLGQVGVVIR